MSQNIYVARQPIIDTSLSVFGYELLFRSVQKDGSILPIFEDDLLATTRVLVNTLNHIGINNLVQDQQAFINIDEEMLMDNMITTIPKERFILELLETIHVTPNVIKRIKSLREYGYRFALDDAHCNADFSKTLVHCFPTLISSNWMSA